MKAKNFFRNNGSTILTIIGALGVIGTGVSAAYCTPKALRILSDCRIDNDEKLTTIKKVAPAYIPAAGIAFGTIACILSANALNRRQQAMLISAYGYLNQTYQQYRNQVRNEFGAEVDKTIAATAEECVRTNSEKFSSADSCLFYDPISNRYFERSMLEVTEAELHLNRNYQLRGYCELNEFYEFLGLEPTDYGATIGWGIGVGFDTYGYSWIDFVHDLTTMPDGLECFVLDMPFPPTPDFMD